MCASVFNVHIVIFDEFSIFRVDENNASNIAKSWIRVTTKKTVAAEKNCGKTNQIAKFHRLNGVKHPVCVCVQIRSRWFANSNSSSTSIDNTSIRFIIQCLIVYLPVSFWLLTHWRAVIISLVPNACMQTHGQIIVFLVLSPILLCILPASMKRIGWKWNMLHI